MKRNKTSETGTHIREKRRALAHDRWKRRATAIAWYGLLAEVFSLPLSPSVATVALLVGIAGTALRFYADKEFHFRHLRFDVPAVLFVAVSGLSVLSSPDRGFSFYNYYNLVGVYVLTYLLIGQNVREPGQMKSILRMACAAAVIVLLYGYYQFLFGIDISSMKWVDGDAFPELRKRVFSTWENPNILAGYLDIIICLAFGLFMKCRDRERRILLGAFMIAAAACLAMTYARGACLVIAVILAGYGVLRDRRVLVACILVVAILFVLDPMLYERITSVFTKVDTSTEMRLAFWESTVAMIQDHPFLGIGWGRVLDGLSRVRLLPAGRQRPDRPCPQHLPQLYGRDRHPRCCRVLLVLLRHDDHGPAHALPCGYWSRRADDAVWQVPDAVPLEPALA